MKDSEQSEVKDKDLPLPKGKLPSCWFDEMRMNYLYTKFRSNYVNPSDFETKMNFWSSIVQDWCLHHNRPIFTLGDLKKAFHRDGRSPECLPAVIETLYRNGDLLLKSEFEKPPLQSWGQWTVNLVVKKPVTWALSKLMSSAPLTDDTQLVHLSACKSLGDKLAAGHKDRVLELSELATRWGVEDVEQVLVVVHGLRRTGKAAIHEGSPTLVKLGAQEISEVDLGVHVLHKNEQTLAMHLEQLETEKQAALQDARTNLAKNMRQAAKSCLKKKHVLDKCIEKRASALDNVRVLLSRIQEAKTDAKILEAYQLGVTALKTTLKTSGLTEDSASDTMMAVQEVLDVHDEIETALSQPLLPEDDLEAELAELLKQPEVETVDEVLEPCDDELEQRLKALSVAGLPSPPKSVPVRGKERVALPAM